MVSVRPAGVDATMQRVSEDLRQIRLVQEALATLAGGSVGPDGVTMPSAYISIPPTKLERLALPAGETVFDFEDGTGRHESGEVLVQFKSLQMLRSELGESAAIRSVYAFSDIPALIQLNEDPQFATLDSCSYYNLGSQDIQRITLRCGVPAEIEMLLATRSDAFFFTPSPVTSHAERVGEVVDPGASFVDLPVQPVGLALKFGQSRFAAAPMHTISFGRVSIGVRNVSGRRTGADAGAEIDLRLLARSGHEDLTLEPFRVVDEVLGVPDGQAAEFEVSRPSHFLKIQVRSATAGSRAAAALNMTAING